MGMTVLQLYVELQKLMEVHPDTISWAVVTEGCDCYGDVGEVLKSPHAGEKSVLLLRGRTKAEEEQDRLKREFAENAYNQYLLNRISPELRGLLPD